MFEQSTLPSASRSKRFWATSAGAMGECLLLLFAIAAPMIWPDVLPRTNLITSWLPPVPHDRPKPIQDRLRPTVVRTTTVGVHPGFWQPPSVPTGVIRDVDPPENVDPGPWVPGGIDTGVPGAPPNSALNEILRAANVPVPVRPVETARPTPAAAPPAEIRRVSVGGRVKMAEIVRRVEPIYPMLAKQVRVQGEVQIVAVIGIDGRIKELRVASGHPLLARAAIDAVSQWIYRPTTLNDEPVEVIAPITVTFRLN